MFRPVLVFSLTVAVSSLTQAAPKEPPAPGTVFYLTEAYPSYVTADIEFRDPEGKKWPSFSYGKPYGDGELAFDPTNPKASFSLLCDRMTQNNGDQSRRVAGEAIDSEGNPTPITFQVSKLGTTEIVKREETDKRGKTKVKDVAVTPAEGTLGVGDKKVRMTAEMTYTYPHRDGTFYMTFRFQIHGSDLGFRNHFGPIDVKASCSGFQTKTKSQKKK